MPLIELATLISAPRERVFDLARSIDAHHDSTEGTSERAIAGVTGGLIGLNDEVTWEAWHLGLRQRLTVRVTGFRRPQHFQDIMVAGAFKSMKHDHEFLEQRRAHRWLIVLRFSRHWEFLASLWIESSWVPM